MVYFNMRYSYQHILLTIDHYGLSNDISINKNKDNYLLKKYIYFKFIEKVQASF